MMRTDLIQEHDFIGMVAGIMNNEKISNDIMKCEQMMNDITVNDLIL